MIEPIQPAGCRDVHLAAVEQVAQIAAEERAGDSQQRRQDDAHRLRAGHQKAGDHADHETKHDHADNFHNSIPPD